MRWCQQNWALSQIRSVSAHSLNWELLGNTTASSALNFRPINTKTSRPNPRRYHRTHPQSPPNRSSKTVLSRNQHQPRVSLNRYPPIFYCSFSPLDPAHSSPATAMAGGKGKSSGGKSSGGKTGERGPKKQQSHSARAGLRGIIILF